MVEKDKYFREIIDPSRWKRFEEYAPELQKRLAEDLRKAEDRNRSLVGPTRKLLEREFDIKSVSDKDLKWAEHQLYATNVCAVDGTYSSYSLLSGVRGQIGVAAVSYANQNIEEVLFVFEPDFETETEDVADILQRRKSSERGALVPYELRTGLGRYRALPVCLGIAEKIIENKHAIGVIESSTHDELRSIGLALNPAQREYVALKNFADELQSYLYGDDFTSAAHFNEEDRKLVDDFKDRFGHQLMIGLYRVGPKSYVFEAHKDFFDQAAALLARDSLHQPERGFPLLIDHADSICSYVLSAADFKKRVEHELAKLDAWGREVYERRTRRR